MLSPTEQWTLHGYYEFTKNLTERVPAPHPNTVPAPISAVSSALGCRVRHGIQDRLEPTRRSGCVARAGECLVGDPLPDAVSMAGRPVHSEQVFDLIRCEAAPCFEPGVARPRAGGVAGEDGRRDERAGARHCAAPYGLPVAAGRH